MTADNRGKRPNKEDIAVLKKLLGSLELEVMEHLWQVGDTTVHQVAKVINRRRPIAYTTVMTVMGHLVDKRLLARTKEGKRYRYQVARSRDEFLRDSSRSMVRALLSDFGDLAIAQFLGEIGNVNADRREQPGNPAQETESGGNVSG